MKKNTAEPTRSVAPPEPTIRAVDTIPELRFTDGVRIFVLDQVQRGLYMLRIVGLMGRGGEDEAL